MIQTSEVNKDKQLARNESEFKIWKWMNKFSKMQTDWKNKTLQHFWQFATEFDRFDHTHVIFKLQQLEIVWSLLNLLSSSLFRRSLKPDSFRP